MSGVLYKAGDANYPRAPDHTAVLGSMLYQIFRNVLMTNEFGFMIWAL